MRRRQGIISAWRRLCIGAIARVVVSLMICGRHHFAPKIASRDGLFFRNNTKQ